MVTKYDAIIIGAGQAGFPLAGNLTGRGWKVALAEGAHLGGTCVNTGCSPTKTIVASARVAHLARRGADYGVHTGDIRIDFAKVMARQQAIVQRFRGGLEDWLTGIENLTIYRHFATFESANRVRVGDEIIESDRIYINVGGRSFVPPIEGLDTIFYLDNERILQLTELPKHLIVIGGGYIGLEYAQAFRRLGSDVTVIELGNQIMGREDADIVEEAMRIFDNEGIDIRLKTKTTRVEAVANGVRLFIETDGVASEIEGSHLLIAIGRKPNSDRLGLDKAGVETDKRGFIVVDDHLQTNVNGIWALGDVNGRGAFTHTSWNDHEIVVNQLDGGNRKVSDRIPVYGVYIDPPLGRVGMSEQEVRESGRKALIGVKYMTHISRAQENDETNGLMKVLVDAETGLFLGATIFGIGGDEIVHSIIDLMYAKAPYTVMKHAVHVHPTVSELIPTLLGELKPLD